jgi:GcrA cell cycle regulator
MTYQHIVSQSELHTMSWTPERIDLLQRLWLQGQTASQIAEQLGDGVTRNAVIGKAHRLGLSGRPTPVSKPIPKPVLEEPRRPVVAGPSGRACMWPVGDPKTADFHFCNAPTEAGRPYCATHCSMAYQRKSEVAA